MRHTRLTILLAAVPLTAVACGTATSPTDAPSTSSGPGDSSGTSASVPTGASPSATAHAFAAALLDRSFVPPGARSTGRSPSKALDRLPEMPGLNKPPIVVKRFWTVDSSAADVFHWLRSHRPSGIFEEGEASTGAGSAPARFLSYRSTSLPASVAAGYLYVAVVPTGPSTSAIGAYALTLPQPPRPAAEIVPLDVSSVLIGWSLGPGGTPARKLLTGPAAVRLTRDFNRLRVDTSIARPCPMIPGQSSNVVVRFSADGHTWQAEIPACPDIAVTRDGSPLPPLAFGPAFLDDVKHYTGDVPWGGPPVGGVVPLVQPAAGGER